VGTEEPGPSGDDRRRHGNSLEGGLPGFTEP